MREAQVAPLERRFSAAAFDTSLVLLVLAFFAVTFYVLGGEVHVSLRAALPWVGFGLILDLAYRIVLCVLRADSVGMHFAHLRLVNFDGQDAEPAQRWIRLVAACLSVAAAGLGLLWALFDEEKLTWHDQISKTFPTPDDQPVSRPRRP